MAKKSKLTEGQKRKIERFHKVKKEGPIFMYKKSQAFYWSARILRMGLISEELLTPISDELAKSYASDKYLENNCNSNVRLLYCYAIETILKTLNLLKSGTFKEVHNCADLASTLQPIKFSKEENKILKILEEEVLWAARYPTAKSSAAEIDHYEQRIELLKKHQTSLSDEKLDALWVKLDGWRERAEFMGTYLKRLTTS